MNLDREQRRRLIVIAKQSIQAGLGAVRWRPMPSMDLAAPLREKGGSFVTLRSCGQLRGCCGTLAAQRPVGEDVWRNAWASAFADPRFAPLEQEEWPDLNIHISVIGALEPIPVSSEDELLQALRPRVDGLVLEYGESRATFLPEVWEQLPEPQEFVRHLKQKAGWPADAWSPHIKAQRYATLSFGEED